MSERSIVTLPYRGLRCRELECQAEIVMATTTRHRQMPLEREPTFLGALIDAKPEGEELDERGLFVAVRSDREMPAIALSLKAAVVQSFTLHAETPVYRAHWAGCVGAARFRRSHR